MDNASKALIMAGAILIAVALVGLGVYLYQTASGTISQSSEKLDASRIQTENAQFEQYEGNRVTATEVKALVRQVEVFNAKNIFPDDITVTVTGTGAVTASTVAGVINDERSIYTVECTGYDADDGYLTAITVTRN